MSPYLTANQAAEQRAILGVTIPAPVPVSRKALVAIRKQLRA